MRKSLNLTLTLAALLFAVAPSLSYAKTIQVSITRDQMNTVCGSGAQTGGGHTGCDKKCGNTMCDYDCNNKTNKCTGTVLLVKHDDNGPHVATGQLPDSLSSVMGGSTPDAPSSPVIY